MTGLHLSDIVWRRNLILQYAFKSIGVDISFGDALKMMPEYIRMNIGAALFNNIFGVLTYIGGAVICVIQYINDIKVSGRAVMLIK